MGDLFRPFYPKSYGICLKPFCSSVNFINIALNSSDPNNIQASTFHFSLNYENEYLCCFHMMATVQLGIKLWVSEQNTGLQVSHFSLTK